MATRRTVKVLGGVRVVVVTGIFSLACVPGSGSVERPRKDGLDPQDGPTLSLVDGTQPTYDGPRPSPDQYVLPRLDTAGTPLADQGPPPGPTPPFGSSVGLTAANFGAMPDCNGQTHDLHGYYNKHVGVVLLLNKGS